MINAFMSEIMEAISLQNHVIIYTDKNAYAELKQWGNEHKIEIIGLPFSRKIDHNTIIAVALLILKLRKGNRKSDILICTSPLGIMAGTMSGFILRYSHITILFQGFLWSSRRRSLYGGFVKKCYFYLDKLACKLASKIFVISPSAVKLLRRLSISHNAECISKFGSISGVDDKKFFPCEYKRLKLRNELGLKNKHVLIGCISRLHPDKGLNTLYKSFKKLQKLSKDNPDQFKLLIAGPNEGGLDGMTHLLCNDPDITFIPKTVTSSEYYPAFDIFCMPSEREGFGNVYIEAAFNKIPSIALRRTGIVDAVKHLKTGYLIGGGESALTSALFLLGKNAEIRNHMGENAFATANDCYRRPDVVNYVVNNLTKDHDA